MIVISPLRISVAVHVLALAVCVWRPASSPADEFIPPKYPQIEVQRLKPANLRAKRGSELIFSSITFRNPEQGSVEAGRLDFTAKEKAVILLMASWADDDEGTGEWTSEVLTRKQLGQTWIDLGPAPWDETQVLFARECKTGETYSIRTRKFDPPLPILAPRSLMTKKRLEASTLREALTLALRPIPQTPEEVVEYLAYGVPQGAAVIAANDTQLLPLEAENIPPYLQGAKIYRPVKSERPGGPVSSDTVKFSVRRAGPLYLMASWAEDEEHLDEALSYRQLLQEWAPLGRCPWNPEYRLFFRNCEVGYVFESFTRPGHPPLPIVAPSVDVLAELPEGSAVLDVEVMKPYALQGDKIPAYLRGGVIYKPHKQDLGVALGHSMLRFRVQQPGPVYLLASWRDEVPATSKRNLKRTSYHELCDDWMALGRCPWDQKQWMFVRFCRAGESFQIKTRDSAPPLPIVVKPVDLRSEEYADSIPEVLRARQVAVEVRRLQIEKDYAELERLVDEHRRTDARFSSLRSPLQAIYYVLTAVEKKDSQHYTDRIAQLDKWAADAPESLTAHVALAGTLRRYGYFIRGNGFADTLSERQVEAFEEQLLQANRVLKDLDERVPRDVSYYAERIRIGMGLGASRDDVLKWALAAAELDPWNEAATGAAMTYFLQRWHGEPGDLVRLAETLVDATRDECGEALYARVVMKVRDFQASRTFVEDDFSWKRTRQGLADLRRRFPKSDELLNIQCQLAGIALDRELAAACFDEIGEKPELKIWYTVETYDLRRRAFSPAVYEGDQERMWMPHAYGAEYVRFSPDGTKLLTSGTDCLIKVWDVASGRELRRMALTANTNCIDFLNDETIAIGGYYGELIVWNWEQDETVLEVGMPERIVSLDCSDDGRYLFFAQSNGNSTVLDLQFKQDVHQEEQLHGKRAIGVFSADSRLLATAGADNGIIIHDLHVGRADSALSRRISPSSAIALSADGSLVAAGNAIGMVQVWQRDGWKSVADTPPALTPEDRARVRTLAFTPDRRSLVIARSGGVSHEKSGLWMLPLDGRSPERRIAGHVGSVDDVDVSPDGKTLVSVGADWTLRLYDLQKLATE